MIPRPAQKSSCSIPSRSARRASFCGWQVFKGMIEAFLFDTHFTLPLERAARRFELSENNAGGE